MKVIYDMEALMQRICPEQTGTVDPSWRVISFCITEKVENGLLLYHTMTKELLLLDEDEQAVLTDPAANPRLARYLANRWFLVPAGHDDCRLADEIRSLYTKVQDALSDKRLHSFTILPTTDCNARCPYCYEKGCPHVDMTMDMARKVAEYIAREGSPEGISLSWFGGQPLMNQPVIDHICGELRERGIPFASSITTNAYLFDEASVKKAREQWNLRQAQITLDGTEEYYNQTKSYITEDTDSPYQRVLRNIRLLHAQGIMVNVRLNLGLNNYDMLCALVDELAAFMSGQGGYGIYSHVLFDIEQSENTELRHRAARMNRSLTAYIRGKGCSPSYVLKRFVECTTCQANSGQAIVIDPRGTLYPCEHFNECEPCGTIFDDSDRFKNIADWRKLQPKVEDCTGCAVYPVCLRPAKCPAVSTSCIGEEKDKRIRDIREQMLFEYNSWRNID